MPAKPSPSVSTQSAAGAWAGQIPEGLTRVTVRVLQVPVEHTVSMQTFRRWLEQPGTTPAERMARTRVKEILER